MAARKPTRKSPSASPKPSISTPPTSRPRQPSAFMASAARVKLDPNTTPRRTEEWQKQAWNLYDTVGEIQHAIDYIANHISKLRLFGAFVPTDPREPPQPDPSGLADAAITSLRTSGGTYSSLLRELTVHLFVAGEAYLVGRDAANVGVVSSWDVLSNEELKIGDSVFTIRDYPGGTATEYKEDEIVVIHIMFPHPRWGGLPISPLRGVLTSGAQIQGIEMVISAASKSRQAGNGLLLIPEEASFGAIDPTVDASEDPMKDPFTKVLITSMITPIQDPGSASAVVPLVLRGPADVLKEIRKVDLSIDLDAELIKMDGALTRLAQGLPLPPEVVTGKGGASHWSAWSISEDVVSAYVEPFAVPIIDALTTEYYRPFLGASDSDMAEEEIRKRMFWYDVTALITRPNRSADADFGLEHIALSEHAWRRIKGFTDEDAPDKIETLARLLLQRGSLDPISTVTLLKVLGIVPEDTPTINIQQPPTPTPPSAETPEDRSPPAMTRPKSSSPPTRSANSSPLIILPSNTLDGEQVGIQLANLDRDLTIRLHAAADAALTRSLERATSTIFSKLRNHTRYSTILRSTPKSEVASRIGRAMIEAEGIDTADLLSNAFDPLATQFRTWAARTYSKATRIIGLTGNYVPAEQIEAAAVDLTTHLTSFATDRLYGQLTADEPLGEADSSITIPHGLIRSALYLAGGGVDAFSYDSSPPTYLPSESSPPTGIATGTILLNMLAEAGGSVDCYEWVYTSSVRTSEFEPHAALDGLRFTSFSDPALANKGTWPPVPFLFPGDHTACSCMIRPILQLSSIAVA